MQRLTALFALKNPSALVALCESDTVALRFKMHLNQSDANNGWDIQAAPAGTR